MAANPLQLSIVNFPKGAYLTVEGKPDADHFYIIRSGRVRITREISMADEEGGQVLEPGDFFGVVATMSSHSHVETAMGPVEGIEVAHPPGHIEEDDVFGDLAVPLPFDCAKAADPTVAPSIGMTVTPR